MNYGQRITKPAVFCIVPMKSFALHTADFVAEIFNGKIMNKNYLFK